MPSRALIGSALALTAGVMWSFGVLTVRFAEAADPFQYLIWRGIGVILVMELLSVASGGGLITPRFLKTDRLGFIAASGLVLAAVAFVFAVKTTTVANAVFFSSTAPLQTAVLARIFLGERLGFGGGVAIAIGLSGLLVMAGGDLGSGNLAGNLGGLASAFGFAIYAVCIRMAPGRDWSPMLAGYGLLTLAVCLGVTMLNGRPVLLPAVDTTLALVHGAILIGFGTIIFNRASNAVPAVGLTVLAQTETVFAPLWVYLALGETPKTSSLVGGALILTAIVIKALSSPRAKVTELGETPA